MPHYLNPNNRNMTLFPEAPLPATLEATRLLACSSDRQGRSGLIKPLHKPIPKPFGWKPPALAEYPFKPAPHGYSALCDQLGVEPEGPSSSATPHHDLEMAANAKIRAIAVTTGAHTAKQLSSLPHVAMLNMAELPDVLETL